jgi:hypothetical protein
MVAASEIQNRFSRLIGCGWAVGDILATVFSQTQTSDLLRGMLLSCLDQEPREALKDKTIGEAM